VEPLSNHRCCCCDNRHINTQPCALHISLVSLFSRSLVALTFLSSIRRLLPSHFRSSSSKNKADWPTKLQWSLYYHYPSQTFHQGMPPRSEKVYDRSKVFSLKYVYLRLQEAIIDVGVFFSFMIQPNVRGCLILEEILHSVNSSDYKMALNAMVRKPCYCTDFDDH
jgi:hypothetical protein